MRHVNAIEKLIENGHVDEAHESLEELLAIGPNNVQALKLLAALYVHEGRFEDEEKVWRRVFEIDNEDIDAIEYFQKVQLEDREHYYFTDVLPGGGRRFIAYPRSLVNISMIGLVGCVGFLLLTRFSSEQEMMKSPLAVMTCFLVLVISPWVGIIYTWAKSLRTVNVTSSCIEIKTRFKSFRYDWDQLKKISLAHSQNPSDEVLRLVIVPSPEKGPPVTIDFNEDTSSIRARRYLINEIRDFHSKIDYDILEDLNLNKKTTVNL
ncbi:tetratricopeptide repeat protein [Pseudobacteriovorax antillogorgiicola]|nr:tetratricopeptide repeat protein [Pseudobacteriovorax antillogorgiicola]